MPLTKMQYESISRRYEETQNKNHRIHTARRDEIYAKLPAYRDIDQQMASLSIQHGLRLLDGDDSAITDLRVQLEHSSAEKKKLLADAGYPTDYLEPIYDCKDCQDSGYIGNEKCHCFRQQEIRLLYEQSNIQATIEKENFETLSYEYYDGEDLKAFEAAVAISKDFVAGFQNHYQNILYYGTVGTGKSFLSGCIARELLACGKSVIYFSANGLFEQLARYSFDTKMKEGLYNFYKDLYNCDLVIVDDLGTEVTNNFVCSQLFALLNERHLRQKATIISTNLQLSELRERYSERVFSRIASNYTICRLSGADIRLQKRMGHKLKSS